MDSLLDIGFQLTRFQGRLILFCGGIRKKVKGQILKDKEVSYVICPNHTSFVDILMLYEIFPHYFIFLGKKELGSIPFFRLFFKKLNILVDRKNPKAAHEAILKASERLQEGTNVVIFPEGTISPKAPELIAFKSGAFRIATQLQMPIIPVTFKNNYKLLEDSWSFWANSRPGVSEVIIHDPIYPTTEAKEELLNLQSKCREAISSGLETEI